MKHLINGVYVNLRELTNHELDALVKSTQKRVSEADDDLEKLQGEVHRRDRHDVPLFAD